MSKRRYELIPLKSRLYYLLKGIQVFIGVPVPDGNPAALKLAVGLSYLSVALEGKLYYWEDLKAELGL